MGNTGAMHSQMQVSEITGVSVSFTTRNIYYICHDLPILIINASNMHQNARSILGNSCFWGPFQSESPPSNSPFAIQSTVRTFSQDDFDTFDSLGFTDSACGTCTGGKKVPTTLTTPQLFAGFASSKKWKTPVFSQDLKVEGRVLSLCGCFI